MEARGEQPVFYYDLACPACYLVAERVMSELPSVPEWEPVHGPAFAHAAIEREEVERRAQELGLQPLRWPRVWPPASGEAMLAATYAKHIGRAVAFSLACYRQVFAGGRDLSDRDTVLIAAAACEMHPAAVIKGIGLRSTIERLQYASGRAAADGVRGLPAIVAGGRVYDGTDALAGATAELGERA